MKNCVGTRCRRRPSRSSSRTTRRTRRGDLGAQSYVAPKVEPVDHVVEVALGLRLLREVLLPLPLFEQLFREQVAVGASSGVEPCLGVAVPVPGAADATTGLEQLDGEPCFTLIQLVDAGDAGADDQDVDLGASAARARRVQVRRGSLYRPVSIRSVVRQHLRSGKGALRGDADRKRSALPVLRDGVPGPGPQGALLRPGLLRDGSRAALARLADGLQARGDPAPNDFVEYEFLDQSIIVLRTDDMGCAFQNACRHRGVKVVEEAGRARTGSPARSMAGATASTARTLPSRGEDVLRAQPPAGRHQPRPGAVRGVGRVRVDQPRRRRAALRPCIEPCSSARGRWSRAD